MDQSSATPRPSGIPRPAASRLPVLRPSGSQSALRTPASTEQLRNKPSVSSLSRPPQPTAPLQKKTSRASLVRSNTPSTAVPAPSIGSRASLASSSRRVSGIPSVGPPRTTASTPSHDAPVFKRPFARPPSRQAKVPTHATTLSSSSREDDALGSLDGFRSASRASSRASSRAGSRDHEPDSDPECALDAGPEPEATQKKKSRPSLSERTVESLSQLPSSPAAGKGRRRSSFFTAENSMPPPLRPASAMSNNSRPSTSEGPGPTIPATPKRFGLSSGRLSMTAPGKRSVSANVATPTATPSRTSLLGRPPSTVKKQPLSTVQNLQSTPKPRLLAGSKSLTARTTKPRPSLGGVFGQAISPPPTAATDDVTPSAGRAPPTRTTPAISRKVSSSSTALREQIAKAKSSRQSDVGVTPPESPSTKPGNSSNALREQIAKAREAARKSRADPVRTSTPPRDAIVPDPAEIAGFDFGLDDPFNQGGKGGKSVLRKRIDGARTDGRLNFAAMGLTEIPNDVLNMYKYDPNDTAIAWGEVVDLDVMILADNELEALPDAMFPDVDFQDLDDSDETSPQFGGVQTIDLHGNLLKELPVGLGRLTQLTKLNLSRNKLSMQVLDVIGRISTLRELKLAENELQGDLSVALCRLSALEVLELQTNRLSSIPQDISGLSQLRILNVFDNQLQSLPQELFMLAALVELQASKNRLAGSLCASICATNLQELQVANNSLTSLTDGNAIVLSSLRILNISTNRIAVLPDISEWSSLTHLLASENKLKTLPDGFTVLQRLRTADFTGNEITQLDNNIALMEQLEHLTVAANPLRERKFLSMNTEDIKRDLMSRLQPDDAPASIEDDAIQELEGGGSESSMWQPNRLGTLDLSKKTISDLDENDLQPFADNIQQFLLQQNVFTAIPTTLSVLNHLTLLDLSKNGIEIALTAPLELSKLRELRLAGNKMLSLEPITTFLTAPALQILDVSRNFLSGPLPLLRSNFPDLITLLASDNSISDVNADALSGLKIVNLSNNDIERLEPRIGLLQGTLTGFEVEGNKFRVPNWQVLRKGTDATLTWLRDKLPRESWRSDGTEFFDADDGSTF
ncbi:hypothetical protein ACN47E_005716 [Coniothyrium glycines]